MTTISYTFETGNKYELKQVVINGEDSSLIEVYKNGSLVGLSTIPEIVEESMKMGE